METKQKNVTEVIAKSKSGGLMLLLDLLGWAADIALFVFATIWLCEEKLALGGIAMGVSGVLLVAMIIISCGFHVIAPNQAMVFTFFGKYYGTIKEPGFYYMNPFLSAVRPVKEQPGIMFSSTDMQNRTTTNAALTLPSPKVSLKTRTLKNDRQKVNDVLGNPIIIGANVIWKVVDPTAALLNVENYDTFLSTQCDSVIRNIARMYPYDTMESDTDEKTLRGSSNEIADVMQEELQKRVADAGIYIEDVRITSLAYSEEIAAAMLQRQQAVAIIAARQKIVEGAVSMVKMAIDQLSEEEVVVLDEERKAAMVSNLLVVLCGNKDAQPIVNSGSIY